MAIIPKVASAVERRGIPGVRLSDMTVGAAYAGGAAEKAWAHTLGNLGDDAMRLGAHWAREDERKREIADEDAGVSAYLNLRKEWSGKQRELTSREGVNARGVAEEAGRSLEELAARHESGLSAGAADAFRRRAEGWRIGQMEQMSGYEDRHLKAAADADSEALLGTAEADAGAGYGDSRKAAESFALGMGEIGRMAERNGWGPEKRKAAEEGFRDRVENARIETAIEAGDFAWAEGALSKVKNADPRLTARVKSAREKAEEGAAVDGAWGKYATPDGFDYGKAQSEVYGKLGTERGARAMNLLAARYEDYQRGRTVKRATELEGFLGGLEGRGYEGALQSAQDWVKARPEDAARVQQHLAAKFGDRLADDARMREESNAEMEAADKAVRAREEAVIKETAKRRQELSDATGLAGAAALWRGSAFNDARMSPEEKAAVLRTVCLTPAGEEVKGFGGVKGLGMSVGGADEAVKAFGQWSGERDKALDKVRGYVSGKLGDRYIENPAVASALVRQVLEQGDDGTVWDEKRLDLAFKAAVKANQVTVPDAGWFWFDKRKGMDTMTDAELSVSDWSGEEMRAAALEKIGGRADDPAVQSVLESLGAYKADGTVDPEAVGDYAKHILYRVPVGPEDRKRFDERRKRNGGEGLKGQAEKGRSDFRSGEQGLRDERAKALRELAAEKDFAKYRDERAKAEKDERRRQSSSEGYRTRYDELYPGR